MNNYFVFTDESGSYMPNCSMKFCKSHPYYIRTFVSIPMEEYFTFQKDVKVLIGLHGIDGNEIKWSDLWEVESGRYRKAFLSKLTVDNLKEYITEFFTRFTNICKNSFIVITVTDNSIWNIARKERMIGMHFQDAFQRVQMQLENSGQGVAMFIMDELDSETDRKTKNSCHSLISKGDMFVKFNNIFPSVMVDFSHQNYGIQLADYVSGVATGILKYASVKKGYEFARDLYGKFIANKLRRNNKNGEVRGCGVLDVPHNSYLRGVLKVFESGDSIKEVKKSKLSIPLDSDIPF